MHGVGLWCLQPPSSLFTSSSHGANHLYEIKPTIESPHKMRHRTLPTSKGGTPCVSKTLRFLIILAHTRSLEAFQPISTWSGLLRPQLQCQAAFDKKRPPRSCSVKSERRTSVALIRTFSNRKSVLCFAVKPSEAETFEEEMARMREEIDELKKEALTRMDLLSSKLTEVNDGADTEIERTGPAVVTAASRSSVARNGNTSTSSEGPEETSSPAETPVIRVKRQDNDNGSQTPSAGADALYSEPTPTRTTGAASHHTSSRGDLDLLAGTHWKVMLNIGREPGTWMPKTWGVSGDRLLLNLELCFEEDDQEFNREDFLGGEPGSSKVCRVVHHELSIAPSMTEGSRRVQLRDGGWRVARGEGPLGTDVLKFYIECDQEIRHQGGDVYCPPGRIYCSCGYFIMHRPSGVKDDLHKELNKLDGQYETVNEELEEEGLLSLKRIKLSKELFDISGRARDINKRLKAVSITEPDRSLLRVSRKGDVGLTREGGVCCKVSKGAVTEYHILGRFSVAAIEPRDESDD